MRLGVLALTTTLAALSVTACTQPAAPAGPDPAEAIGRLTEGLSKGDLSQVPATVDPAASLTEILKGMDGVRPQVQVAGQRRTGDSVTVDLDLTWPFATPWSYRSTAGFTLVNGVWTLAWQPSIVHPELTYATRLVHTHEQAQRGRITGAGGVPLTETQLLTRIGIDKSRVPAEQAEAAARRLAAAYKVDADRFAATVKASGPQQFVEAIVVRSSDPEPKGWRDIPGAIGVPVKRNVAVDREVAPELIGVTGEATKAQLDAAPATVFPGDQVGLTGLQKRWDAQLVGKPATKVTMVPTGGAGTPTPTATPSTSATPAPTKKVLFEAPAVQGADVALSLDPALQKKAEAVLAKVGPAASLVAIRPSTGRVVTAANGPGSQGNADATFGRYAPGSTFKVVTALALLRSGMTPQSPVECTPTVTVDGRTFTNYSDFPQSRLGTMTLAQALETSCNTAIIAQHDKVDVAKLRAAAASLGFGTDYEAGFGSFFGTVGDPANVVGLSETMIGQGKAEASPMAMAGVTASVAGGRTVVPQLVDGATPPAPPTPLTPEEAQALQSMMQGVVANGTGSVLKGVARGAKTGTAEYGATPPFKTSAWMIAYADDLAVAVWVAEGESGSKTAAPLIKAFLG